MTFKLQRARKERDVVQCHLYVEVRLTTQVQLASKILLVVSSKKTCFKSCGSKECNNSQAFALLQLGEQDGRERVDSDLSDLSTSPLGNFLALEGSLSNRLHQLSVCHVLSLQLQAMGRTTSDMTFQYFNC